MKVRFKRLVGSLKTGCLLESLSDNFFKGKEYYVIRKRNIYFLYSVELVKKACKMGFGSEPAICHIGKDCVSLFRNRDNMIFEL